MSDFKTLNGIGDIEYIKAASGDGSIGTPWIFQRVISSILGGASPDIGAVADAAIVTDTTGSLSGKLRGLVKWAFERMPAALGQTTMSASLPVTIASNQTGVPLAASTAMIGLVRDDGPAQTPSSKYVTSPDLSGGVVDLTDAPTSGKRIILDDLVISTDGNVVEVILKEETSGTELISFLMATGAAPPFTWCPANKLRHSTTNKKIQVVTSTAGEIRLWASWHSEV